MNGQPRKILFVDVETTGLYSSDRIVSLGAVQWDTDAVSPPQLKLKYSHLIFDPGKKSHPRAEQVHGYSDWILRHQESFDEELPAIRPLFEESDLIVAHNAGFDSRFIEHEFALAGSPLPAKEYYCTMQAFRQKIGGRAGLNAILPMIGLTRSGVHHGALEDAWLAMQVYLWLNDMPRPRLDALPLNGPSNLKPAPPQPDPLPRRSRKKKASKTSTPIVSTPAPESAIVTPDQAERQMIMSALRPTATVLNFVARSDGEYHDAEVAALTSFVESEFRRLKLLGYPEYRQDVIAALAEIEPTPEMVDAAAKIIVRDEFARAELGKWVKLVTYADGKGTENEQHAIARITEAFAKTRQSV